MREESYYHGEEKGRSWVCGLMERGVYNASWGSGLGVLVDPKCKKSMGEWQVQLIVGSESFPLRNCLEESDTFSNHLPRPDRNSQARVRKVQ